MRFEGESREQLKNGATLLLHRAPALNTVSFTLVLPFAPAEPAGLYHYIEHLFFERAGELRAKEINAAMTANGSEINGFTAQNYMCFSFTCRRAVFQSQLSLLYAMLSQREYGEEEMERVLPVIRNEMFEDNFYDVRSGDVIRSLWFDKRYNQSVLGDMRDLEEATDEELDSCRRMLFNKGMCAFLAGGFAEEDAALVRGTFGQMPLQPFRVPPPQERLHDETPVNRRGRGRELQALVTYHVTDADRELKLAAHWLRSGLFDGLDAPVFAFSRNGGSSSIRWRRISPSAATNSSFPTSPISRKRRRACSKCSSPALKRRRKGRFCRAFASLSVRRPAPSARQPRTPLFALHGGVGGPR